MLNIGTTDALDVPTRCETCGCMRDPDRVVQCAGCGRASAPCGCRRGWAQARSELDMQTRHYCAVCALANT